MSTENKRAPNLGAGVLDKAGYTCALPFVPIAAALRDRDGKIHWEILYAFGGALYRDPTSALWTSKLEQLPPDTAAKVFSSLHENQEAWSAVPGAPEAPVDQPTSLLADMPPGLEEAVKEMKTIAKFGVDL